ncbi:MAG: RHS repeat protein [Prevotellaceae bacterium]|jgi:YD repeat-containing protein|nr:RHS repeat protein [Prevotellaceae bacterium]
MKKIIFLTAINLCAIHFLHSQDFPVTFQSPEAASLGIVGNIPVSYYTGRADISIPLMEIKSGNYTLPVTLSYNSGGLLPDIHPTWVGQNWNLEVGGVITRSVRDLPDEINNNFGYYIDGGGKYISATGNCRRIGQATAYGFLSKMPDKKGNDKYNYTKPYTPTYWNPNETYMNWQYCLGEEFLSPVYKSDNLECSCHGLVPKNTCGTSSEFFERKFADTESDEYFISVSGFSGKMIIGKDGKFHVIGHPEIKVETKTVPTKNFSEGKLISGLLDGTITTFVLTMQDGIQYVFGIKNELSNNSNTNYEDCPIETTATNGNETQIINKCGVATSWMLSRIILTNDEIINFEYSSKVNDKNYSYSYIQGGYMESPFTCQQGEFYSYQDIGHCYLRLIEGKNFKLTFSTSDAKDLPIKLNSVISKEPHWKKLDSIILTDNQNNTVKKVNFTYQSSTGMRLYLTQVSEDGKPPYTFDYLGRKKLGYVKGGRDMWGYYNGKGDNHAYSNILDIDYNKEYFPYSRETTTDITNGMLKQITYPTGGSVEFDFEANAYSRVFRMEFESADNYSVIYTPKIINEANQKYAGGTRIKTITYKNSNKNVESIREYTYPASSGILGVMPALTYAFKNVNGKIIFKFLKSEAFTPSILTNGSYVGYSQVIETVKDANKNTLGSTVYKYTNFDTNPDNPPVITMLPYYYRDFFRPNSRDEERGKLISQTDFSADGKLVKELKFQYIKLVREPFRGLEVKPNPCSYSPDFRASIYEISNNSYLPSRKEEIFYDANGNATIKTVEGYTYNNNNLLTNISVRKSDGDRQVTKFVYPFEITTGNDLEICKKMTDRHILSEYVTKYTYIDYTPYVHDFPAIDTSLICAPSSNYFPLIGFNVISGEYRKFAKYSTSSGAIYKPERIDYLLSKSNATVNNYSSYFKPKISFTYDKFGNILSVTDQESSISTVYLWGYNYQYPVVKIENATVTEVDSIISQISTGNTVSEEAKIFAWRQKLLEKLPNAWITSYTYKPLVGITSITDPQGNTTQFEYDAYGRLIKTRDTDEKLLQQFEYHYKQ